MSEKKELEKICEKDLEMVTGGVLGYSEEDYTADFFGENDDPRNNTPGSRTPDAI